MFLGPPVLMLMLASLVLLLGAWEWGGLISRNPTYLTRLGYVALVAVLAFALFRLVGAQGEGYRLVLMIALGWWALAFVWLLRYPPPIPNALTFVCGLLVMLPFWLALLGLYMESRDPRWVIFAVLVAIAADVGGFFVGRSLGRHKLAPRVSPKKTWEGVAGGLALAMAVSAAAAWFFAVPLVPFLLLAAVMVALSIVGDLTVSMFKRSAGVKDSGQLLPGHGGVLDRIDSLSSSIPLFSLGFSWIPA